MLRTTFNYISPKTVHRRLIRAGVQHGGARIVRRGDPAARANIGDQTERQRTLEEAPAQGADGDCGQQM